MFRNSSQTTKRRKFTATVVVLEVKEPRWRLTDPAAGYMVSTTLRSSTIRFILKLCWNTWLCSVCSQWILIAHILTSLLSQWLIFCLVLNWIYWTEVAANDRFEFNVSTTNSIKQCFAYIRSVSRRWWNNACMTKIFRIAFITALRQFDTPVCFIRFFVSMSLTINNWDTTLNQVVFLLILNLNKVGSACKLYLGTSECQSRNMWIVYAITQLPREWL